MLLVLMSELHQVQQLCIKIHEMNNGSATGSSQAVHAGNQLQLTV
jgi:hypothetical protein